MAWRIELSVQVDCHLGKLDPPQSKRILKFLHERIARLDNPRSIGRPCRDELTGTISPAPHFAPFLRTNLIPPCCPTHAPPGSTSASSDCGAHSPSPKSLARSPHPISIFTFPISRLAPILPNQTLHPPKLARVCSDQRQLAAQRLPRYQQVVRSDRLACLLQSVSDFAGTSRVLFSKFQHLHRTREKHLQAQRIRFRLDALCHAVPKFVQGHRRYPHGLTRLHCLRESLPNSLTVPPS